MPDEHSWWEGRTTDEIARVLAESIPGNPPIEEVREYVAMEREGMAHARATRAEVSVNILYEGEELGPFTITIPRGTVFGNADSPLRFLLAHDWQLAHGDLITVPLFADYSGEEYNIPAQTIDRIIEPIALNDLWNGAQLLIDQPNPATGGSGPSGRLAAQAATPLEREVERQGVRRQPGMTVDASEYPVMGMDLAQREEFTRAVRAHVDRGGVIQFQEGIGAGQVLTTSDGTSFNTMPITQWTHNMASSTSNATVTFTGFVGQDSDNPAEVGQKEHVPEPSVMEAWRD